MPESITCFACDKEPVQQCARCGRPYCEDHGEELCDACLEPASGVPSFTLYRGSLLALLTATALAVWLLVQPPGGETGALQPVVLTPTATVASIITPSGGVTTPETGATTQAGTETPAPEETPTATTGGGGGGTGTYTVESGDTLSTICAQVKPASMSVSDCVDQIVLLNGLSSADDIAVGQELITPQ